MLVSPSYPFRKGKNRDERKRKNTCNMFFISYELSFNQGFKNQIGPAGLTG